METKGRLKNIFFIAVCFVAITINFPKHSINSLSIILLVVSSIGVLGSDFKYDRTIKKKALILSSLLFIYVLGLLHSSDLSIGVNSIKKALPLFLIPLVFFLSKTQLSNNQKNTLFKVFIVSNLCYCLYMVFAVLLEIGPVNSSITSSTLANYLHSNLTIKIDNHPTYMSFTLILCLIFTEYLKTQKAISPILTKGYYVVFSLLIVLLSSKIGIVIYFLVFLYLLSRGFSVQKKLVLVITISALMAVFLLSKNQISQRFYNEIEVIKNSYNLKDKTIPVDNKSQRLIAIDIYFNQSISEICFGQGTGDIQDYLNKKYRYYLPTKDRLAFKGLNYHNQYLQTASLIGVIGLIWFLYVLFLSIKTAMSNNNSLHLLFLISILLFFAIESFFETQRGVMLFAFFNSIFCLSWSELKQNQ